MLEDLTNIQKEKIGKWNLAEEFPFKIHHLNSDEEQEAEDIPIKRSVQDLGKYEGKSPEHYVCNGFKEIRLSGIEDKSHFEFIERNNLDCDENAYSLISDRNLTYTMIDNEITKCFARSEKCLWTEPGIARAIIQRREEKSRRIWEGHTHHNWSKTPSWRSYKNQRSHI